MSASSRRGDGSRCPSGNRTPSRTWGTRAGALIFRHRCWALSISLKAIANPARREPAPFVFFTRPFAPAKGRVKKTKAAGSRRAGLAMAFKLIESAQQRWRKINAPALVPQVRDGVRFPDGQREPSPRREEALIAA